MGLRISDRSSFSYRSMACPTVMRGWRAAAASMAPGLLSAFSVFVSHTRASRSLSNVSATLTAILPPRLIRTCAV